MPDVDTDRGRLYELLRDGRFVLLGGGANDAGQWSALVNAARPANPADLPGTVLVRPDGYVAWANGHAGVADALAAWCGRPARSVVAPE
jgi:hypothetical protein